MPLFALTLPALIYFVDGVTFKNLMINGGVAMNQEEANIITNKFAKNIKFIIEPRKVESLKS
jgi:hypothetical protein